MSLFSVSLCKEAFSSLPASSEKRNLQNRYFLIDWNNFQWICSHRRRLPDGALIRVYFKGNEIEIV